MKVIQKAFLVLFFGVFTTGALHAQYSNMDVQDPVEISDLLQTQSLMHPEFPDSLVSKLEFPIEVFIKQKGGNRKGASSKSDGLGGFMSRLVKNSPMQMDTARLRSGNNQPVTLILVIPSKDLGQGNYQLRGVTTNFNEHFRPTSTSTKILPNSKGIEIHYYFHKGIPKLPKDHEHIEYDEEMEGFKEGMKAHKALMVQHIYGHVCDPTHEICN
ncbi:hypothetical protein [Gracilimonas sp. BCB1]|uniref:hypothetical protein n=1 Tax=Gracilimonas sp. BCB1 TaxID=3152362 RepID=UPI0032D93596